MTVRRKSISSVHYIIYDFRSVVLVWSWLGYSKTYEALLHASIGKGSQNREKLGKKLKLKYEASKIANCWEIILWKSVTCNQHQRSKLNFTTLLPLSSTASHSYSDKDITIKRQMWALLKHLQSDFVISKKKKTKRTRGNLKIHREQVALTRKAIQSPLQKMPFIPQLICNNWDNVTTMP